MATSIQTRQSTVDLGRASLYIDAAIVAASGLALLLAAQPIGAFMGLDQPGVLQAMGALFLPYAALQVWLANRGPVSRRTLTAFIAINAVWVVASVAVLLGGVPALTTGGKWLVGIAADVVAMIGMAQVIAWRSRRGA